MARDRAIIQTGIWGNPDVRALAPLEQWLYLQMWTHPETSYVGVLEWRPGRIAQLSAGTTGDFVRGILPGLQAGLFVVVDEDTEELLLRPYLRHDGLLKQPKLAVSMANAYAATGSNVLRGVIIHELLKLRREHPDYRAWEVPQVVSILKHPSIDPQILGPAQPLQLPLALPLDQLTGLDLPTATTTATTTEEAKASSSSEAKKRPSVRLASSWAPSANHFDLARERQVDVAREAEAFRLHAETHDRHAANWNAAFTTWLKRARPSAAARPSTVEHGRSVDQILAEREQSHLRAVTS